MKRLIDFHLRQWKDQPGRKALVIRGARQVGKTYAVRKLGQEFESYVEINLERKPEAAQLFEKDLDPQRLIRDLGLLMGQSIVPSKTLLFLDEIQSQPQAIMALRYFYEEVPDLHVVAAGSLLDFAIEEVGMPVGRVTSLYLYPVSFIEFLVAIGQKNLAQEICDHTISCEMSAPIHQKILESLSHYLAIGGMPEIVFSWIKQADPKLCFEIQHSLIDTYRQDFNKYAKKHQIKYLEALFNHVPLQLGSRFRYSHLDGHYRVRELSPGLDLLTMAHVVQKIFHTSGQGVPLGAGINPKVFKTLLLDIALAQAVLGHDASPWFYNPKVQFLKKGSLLEAFVGQEILAYLSPIKNNQLYYWQRQERGAQAEVDYLLQQETVVIPIEVKAGKGSTLKSMHTFLKAYPESPYGIRLSTHNYSLYEKIHSYPLYAIAHLFRDDLAQALDFLLK